MVSTINQVEILLHISSPLSFLFSSHDYFKKLYGSAKTSLYWENKLCWIRLFLSFTILIWETNLITATVIVNRPNITLIESNLDRGSPTTRPQTGTSPWPVRSWAVPQELSSRQVSITPSVFTAARHLHYHLSSASCQVSNGIRFS